jgi:3-phosphoshikimate 1-carboxyvinyltransferase
MQAVTVHPAASLRGEAALPGDKSITHRAFLMGAVAEGEIRVRGANRGEDCAGTLALVRALGVWGEEQGGDVLLRGAAGRLSEPADVLDCGNSGTTLRLSAGVLAGQPFLSVLTGDESLRRRPVGRILRPLQRMGARLLARDGNQRPPLVVRGARLRALRHTSPVPSAQVKSCLLLAGLMARGRTEVSEPLPSRDHTERMLESLGVPVARRAGSRGRCSVAVQGPARPRGGTIDVPGDYSAAAFLLVAAAGVREAEVRLRAVGLNPTRAALHPVLASMGAEMVVEDLLPGPGEPRATLVARGGARLQATRIRPEQVPGLIDELPVWAVAAACARGRSVLEGAAELRVKESDRLAVMARNLGSLGVSVEERADGISIEGGALRGGVVDAAGDHRVAMACCVAGLLASEPVTVKGVENVGTSFPGFFEVLRSLGARLELHEV